jgi:hypothetical protein
VARTTTGNLGGTDTSQKNTGVGEVGSVLEKEDEDRGSSQQATDALPSEGLAFVLGAMENQQPFRSVHFSNPGLTG